MYIIIQLLRYSFVTCHFIYSMLSEGFIGELLPLSAFAFSLLFSLSLSRLFALPNNLLLIQSRVPGLWCTWRTTFFLPVAALSTSSFNFASYSARLSASYSGPTVPPTRLCLIWVPSPSLPSKSPTVCTWTSMSFSYELLLRGRSVTTLFPSTVCEVSVSEFVSARHISPTPRIHIATAHHLCLFVQLVERCGGVSECRTNASTQAEERNTKAVYEC